MSKETKDVFWVKVDRVDAQILKDALGHLVDYVQGETLVGFNDPVVLTKILTLSMLFQNIVEKGDKMPRIVCVHCQSSKQYWTKLRAFNICKDCYETLTEEIAYKKTDWDTVYAKWENSNPQ